MASLRWRTAILLAWLMLFFNIERLDLGSNDTINIASGVYVVAMIVAVAGITPMFKRRSLLLLVGLAAALFLVVMIIDPQRQLVGGIHTYITFTSLFLLSVTLVLAYRVGEALEEFTQAVEEITFSNKGEHLRTMNEADNLVQLEMISSRRHQRPLSLVLLQADGSSLDMLTHSLVQDVQRSMMERYVLVTVARVLSKYMRRTDIIVEDKKLGRFVLIAPETSATEGMAMGHRMAKIAQDKLSVQANFSVATFPDQALTFEDLMSIAEQQLREQQLLNSSAPEPEEVVTSRVEQHALAVGAAQPQSEPAKYSAMD